MGTLSGLGYFGLFLGSFLAATIVPFSSDILIIGVLLSGGNPWCSFACATLGNWLGGMTSYGLGWLGKWKWLEKWFKVKQQTLEKQKSKIDRFGAGLAFFSWLPIVGDLFAIALGFYRVKFWKCTVYMLIGKAARFAAWVWLYIKYGDAFINWVHTLEPFA